MGKHKAIKLADIQEAMKPPPQTPTPEQLAKGGYEDRFVMHVDTQTKAKAHVSAHSPVERWYRAKRLTDTQMGAIELVRSLWRQIELRQRVTATYGERTPISFDNEWAAIHEIEARKKLDRIEGYFIPWQWDAFENIARFDEPAGSAGASLGFSGTTGAQAAMLMLVRLVADGIAKEERL